jgi:hypothetical protein
MLETAWEIVSNPLWTCASSMVAYSRMAVIGSQPFDLCWHFETRPPQLPDLEYSQFILPFTSPLQRKSTIYTLVVREGRVTVNPLAAGPIRYRKPLPLNQIFLPLLPLSIVALTVP